MRQFLVFSTVLLTLSGFVCTPSYSQTAPQQTSADQPIVQQQAPLEPAMVTQSAAPANNVPEPEIGAVTGKLGNEQQEALLAFDESKYVDPTYQNLAKLYWALGILDVNNPRFIDNFVAITECEMYKTYINNDLEWNEIRTATRNHLRSSYKTFPTNFKITIPLFLGSYNFEEEFFDVEQKLSSIDSARKIETVYYTKLSTCGLSGEIEGYPRNLILYLNRPFSLPRLPIEKELARLFLDDINSEQTKRVNKLLNPNVSGDNINRMAYLELMFRVHSYKESANTSSGMLKAVVFAQIDYIKVYADYEKEKLLYKKDMFEEERRKRKKRSGTTTDGIIDLPDGPVFGEPVEKKKK